MKKIVSLMLSVLCMLALSAYAAPRAYAADDDRQDKTTPSGIAYSGIGDSVDGFMAERADGIASCVTAVFDGDSVIFEGYYGCSDIENNVKADRDTVYEWGSCSKLLVWTAVMQQWERGNIDLDADIREYLPDGFLTKLKYPEEKITMINLMCHNAGFQESFYEDQQCGRGELFDSLEEAVRACECRQAYHVGEHTAYSNWGSALAAYIVERVSGEDYVSYVHENIFAPLGMEHTSIDPRVEDNEWVEKQREQLRCYERYADSSYNRDLGECRCWLQLFPAGSAIGTLGDFTAFAQAFVKDDCPLFEHASTRDEMFGPTSYYGDSDIAKNRHGMWTSEYKVQVMGHGGNTAGCTANMVFDPESGLGVAVMAAEPGETAFCYGIPGLLYGDMTDREEFRNTSADNTGEDASEDADISGTYIAKRSIVEGAGSFMQYTGGVMPLAKNEDGSYSIKLFGIPMGGDANLRRISGNMYIFDNNGMIVFMYGSRTADGSYMLEMETTDYVASKAAPFALIAVVGFILFGIACVITLLVKLIAAAVRKARGKSKRYTLAEKRITLQQTLYGVSGVVLLMFMAMASPGRRFTVLSGIAAAVLAVLSLVNGCALCYNAVRTGKEIRGKSVKAKNIVWAVLAAAFTVFFVVFRFYNFWTL